MQYLLVTTVFLLALAGSACKSSTADQPTAIAANNRRVVATIIGETNAASDRPVTRPANILNGRIVAVREPLRFVIVDFAGGRMPQLDQRLNVYRLDQKVAEVKISGPYLGTTVAADVTAGEAMLGDLVRDK